MYQITIIAVIIVFTYVYIIICDNSIKLKTKPVYNLLLSLEKTPLSP